MDALAGERFSVIEVGRPDQLMPTWLRHEARRVWQCLAPALIERGVLNHRNAISFGTVCQIAAEYHALGGRPQETAELLAQGRFRRTRRFSLPTA